MPMTLSGTTGIALPSGAAPTFGAYLSTNQSISAATWTKVTCQTKEWDTNSNYDNATNYRFTPTVAGYYQVNAAAYIGGQASQVVAIYKNGSIYKRGDMSSGGGYQISTNVAALVYLNGSTDYVEMYAYQNSGTQTISAAVSDTYFQAFMVRSA